MRHVIPKKLWLALLGTGIACLAVIPILMSVICDMNSMSNDAHKRFKHDITSNRSKYVAKGLKSREPFKIYAGIFGYHLYYNSTEIKTNYYKAIQDCIVTALLS